MAESRHGTDSAIYTSNGEKGGIKKLTKGKKENRKQKRNQSSASNIIGRKKKMQKWIIVIESIFCLVFFSLMWRIEKYAIGNQCGSVFWNYISDSGIQILCGGIADVIISLIVAYKKEKKIIGIIFWQIFLGIMVAVLAFFCFFTYSKIKGAINQQKEALEIQKKNNAMAKMAMQPGESLQGVQKTVTVYEINQDLYMDNRPLEDYYAGEISEENECIVRAEILLRNLESNVPVGSKSENYNKLLETADKEYDTYMYQRNRDKNSETENEALFSDRVDILHKSLNKRKEAHKEYESPENERPLANGYKDMGDEYFGKERQNDAIIAYEESAEWYFKAIYHAAAMGEYEEMEKCMKLLKKLEKEVEKLNEIDSNRKGKIITLVKVYDIFVDMINEDVEQ